MKDRWWMWSCQQLSFTSKYLLPFHVKVTFLRAASSWRVAKTCFPTVSEISQTDTESVTPPSNTLRNKHASMCTWVDGQWMQRYTSCLIHNMYFVSDPMSEDTNFLFIRGVVCDLEAIINWCSDEQKRSTEEECKHETTKYFPGSTIINFMSFFLSLLRLLRRSWPKWFTKGFKREFDSFFKKK